MMVSLVAKAYCVVFQISFQCSTRGTPGYIRLPRSFSAKHMAEIPTSIISALSHIPVYIASLVHAYKLRPISISNFVALVNIMRL